MKPALLCPGILLLILITAIAGCTTTTGTTGPGQTPASPPPTGSTIVPTVTENTQATVSPCVIPPLKIDTSQPMTKVPYGFSFENNNRSYALPTGSIIWHGTDGITRVFDRNGTQLLAANDSDSLMPTPGGIKPSTNVLEVPNGALVQADGNMTHIIVNGTCIGTTIAPDVSLVPTGRICNCPMIPAGPLPPTPSATPDDGLCHCP